MRYLLLIMTVILAMPISLAFAQGNTSILSREVQITSAVAPLPEEFRDGATVLGYGTDGKELIELRKGDNGMTCLADNPSDERFHVACYHESLEPFMVRGRELRAQGISGQAVDSVRYAEVESGAIKMPDQPAALYSLTGTFEHLDTNTGAVNGARPLFVVYVPFATGESTGLPTTRQTGSPWLHAAGTPKAHIMFSPDM